MTPVGLLGMPPRPEQPGTILGPQRPVPPQLRGHAPWLGAVPVMKYTCNDPAGAHCRVFVGNLDTVSLKTRDVETIFGQYGLMCGIVLHKGYAFVQYTNHLDARKACNEDGKTYAGRKIGMKV